VHRTSVLFRRASGLQLCYSDAYARSTEARVLDVQLEPSPAVLLDRTVFYPGGGGQPSDTGTLTRSADGAVWTVASAHKADREIVHDLVGAPQAARHSLTRVTSSRPRSTGRGAIS
jgi:Ser-tRNA(Ala) deacylase AlaX